MDDRDAVAGDVNVELDPVGAELDRAGESGERVLRELAWRATMTDPLGATSQGRGRHSQYYSPPRPLLATAPARSPPSPERNLAGLNELSFRDVYHATE